MASVSPAIDLQHFAAYLTHRYRAMYFALAIFRQAVGSFLFRARSHATRKKQLACQTAHLNHVSKFPCKALKYGENENVLSARSQLTHPSPVSMPTLFAYRQFCIWRPHCRVEGQSH